LFLDELGELPLAAQAMLLRVLETGEVQVLGGAVRKVDVRVVCATHRDLAAEVEAGRFRLDLLYRLAVAEVALPPLRERKGDAAALLGRWLGAPLDDEPAAVLAGHAFPGNVRELRNLARRLEFRLVGAAPSCAELLHEVRGPGAVATTLANLRRYTRHPPEARARSVELAAALASTRAAWRASGLPRSTFYRYLRATRAGASSP
jgi:transcriptional regulator of acetoin/glycerol metabolism